MTVVPAYNLKKRGVGEGPSEINKCASDGKVMTKAVEKVLVQKSLISRCPVQFQAQKGTSRIMQEYQLIYQT